MDSRLKFLHYRYTKKMQGTQKWKITKKEEKLGPQGGVKENLKPYVYKQIERFKARYRTFCRTVQRVIVYGEVKL